MSGENSGADQTDVKKLVEQAVADATKGLINNRDQLKSEKLKLKEEYEALKAQWGDLDPNQVKAIMTRLENDEETKLIAEGKVDEVISRRTQAMQGDFQKRIDAADKIRDDLEGQVGSMQSKIKSLVLDSQIRRNAAELGILPSAVDDALYRAKDIFSIGENDSVVAKDRDGSVLLGKNGRDPLSPAEWIDSMKEKAPHWFAQNGGANASGGAGKASSGAFTLTREQARDPRKYRAAQEAAAKAGQSVQILRD